MHPIDFPEANCIINIVVPNPLIPVVEHPRYEEYKAHRFFNNVGTQVVLTAWQPNKEDLEALNAGHPVILIQFTDKTQNDTLNPVHLYTVHGSILNPDPVPED